MKKKNRRRREVVTEKGIRRWIRVRESVTDKAQKTIDKCK